MNCLWLGTTLKVVSTDCCRNIAITLTERFFGDPVNIGAFIDGTGNQFTGCALP
jgi:hypothetical protein